MIKLISTLAGIIITVTSVSSCNTIKGVGRDLQIIGNGVKNTVQGN